MLLTKWRHENLHTLEWQSNATQLFVCKKQIPHLDLNPRTSNYHADRGYLKLKVVRITELHNYLRNRICVENYEENGKSNQYACHDSICGAFLIPMIWRMGVFENEACENQANEFKAGIQI